MKTVALLVTSLLGVQLVKASCRDCIALPESDRELFRAHGQMCSLISRISAEQFEKLKEGLVSGDDPALMKHVYCVLRQGRIIDGRGHLISLGHFIYDVVRAERCNVQSASSPEEHAWLMYKCALTSFIVTI